MDVTIRPMRAADDAAVEALATAAYGAGFEQPAAFVAKVAAGIGVVAERGGAVVGYGVALPWRGELPGLQSRPAGACPDPEYLHVHDICVAASGRGGGVGSALMRAFERTAGELGLATLRCIAVHGADVVWRRLGWAPSEAAVPPDYPPGSLAMVRTTPP